VWPDLYSAMGGDRKPKFVTYLSVVMTSGMNNCLEQSLS